MSKDSEQAKHEKCHKQQRDRHYRKKTGRGRHRRVEVGIPGFGIGIAHGAETR